MNDFTDEELSEIAGTLNKYPVQFDSNEINEIRGGIPLTAPAIGYNFKTGFEHTSDSEWPRKMLEAKEMGVPEVVAKSILMEMENLSRVPSEFMHRTFGDREDLNKYQDDLIKKRKDFEFIRKEHPILSFASQVAPYIHPAKMIYGGLEKSAIAATKTAPIARNILTDPKVLGAGSGIIEGGAVAGLKGENVPMGATMGALFGYGGAKLGEFLSRTPDMLTDTMKEALKIADEWDMQVLTGAKTNIPYYQKVDAALRGHPDTSIATDLIDDYNNKVLTGRVLKVAGIESDNASTQVLTDAFEDYSKRFQSLIKRSDSELDNQLIEDVNAALKEYDDAFVGQGSGAVKSFYKDLLDTVTDEYKIKGSDYQKYYEKISNAISVRAGSTDPLVRAEFNALVRMREAVDGNIERHLPTLERGRSKELRKQYAAIKLLQEGNVIDRTSGRVDPAALDQVLHRPGNRQSYMRMDGPLQDLHKAAKVGTYLKNQPKADLKTPGALTRAIGTGIEDNLSGFFKQGSNMPLTDRMRFAAYRSGYPHLTGAAFLPTQSVPWITGSAVAGHDEIVDRFLDYMRERNREVNYE